MTAQRKIALCWLRRDLRLDDQAALYYALNGPHPVLPIFIFDRAILDDLGDKDDARVSFLHRTIRDLKAELEAIGTTLYVAYGQVGAVWQKLLSTYDVAAVYTNRDYESYAKKRDAAVELLLARHEIPLLDYKDHVIFNRDEVLKADGTPYQVFTPYSRQWLDRLNQRIIMETTDSGSSREISFYLDSYPCRKYFDNLVQHPPLPMPGLTDMGFLPSNLLIPDRKVAPELIQNYHQTRDIPGIVGTSRLGIHIRFGTLSIRSVARQARQLNATYLSELIWRDFYSMILDHFPYVEHRSFRPKYDQIEWINDPQHFERWCTGTTGYPIVDAGMRELNQTGFMHNRVRMITASFLCKHLLTDWRWGEAYFARKLLDYDLASNNGGWQWAAGTGTDAAPYFRIFNPYSQQKKFDPDFTYISQWVPEYGTDAYPSPVVEHAFARERALTTYKRALDS